MRGEEWKRASGADDVEDDLCEEEGGVFAVVAAVAVVQEDDFGACFGEG